MAKHTFLYLTFILFFCGFASNRVSADEIKMKDGTVHKGRITYEGDDIVKIEVSISASIKETKILGRGDVAELIKDAPDDVEFAKLETLVPTKPLMTASAYQKSLDTGPRAFLRSFPESKHTEKVKEMEKTLLEELDKVERGFIKIEDEWISPQDKKKFADQVESRIRLYKMQNVAKSGNYNGYIAAMREFEALEQGYYGTPAFATSVSLALQVVPALGRQLQSMQRDADYRQAQFEQNKANLDETAKMQVEQARAREEQAYQAGLEVDKKAGIKWVRINPNSKASITSYLEYAAKELKRLKEYDAKTLSEQAEKFVKVDQLVEDGSVERADLLMKEALKMPGKKPSSKSSSKSKKSGSYISTLSNKIKTKKADIAAKAKAQEEAEKSAAITKRMEKAEDDKAGLNIPEAEEGESTMSSDAASDFAALSGAKKKKEAPKDDKEKSSKKKPTKKSDDDEEREPVVSAPVDEGGGFPVGLIIPIITVLLIVGIVLLKLFGKKKEDDDSEEEAADEAQE